MTAASNDEFAFETVRLCRVVLQCGTVRGRLRVAICNRESFISQLPAATLCSKSCIQESWVTQAPTSFELAPLWFDAQPAVDSKQLFVDRRGTLRLDFAQRNPWFNQLLPHVVGFNRSLHEMSLYNFPKNWTKKSVETAKCVLNEHCSLMSKQRVQKQSTFNWRTIAIHQGESWQIS